MCILALGDVQAGRTDVGLAGHSHDRLGQEHAAQAGQRPGRFHHLLLFGLDLDHRPERLHRPHGLQPGREGRRSQVDPLLLGRRLGGGRRSLDLTQPLRQVDRIEIEIPRLPGQEGRSLLREKGRDMRETFELGGLREFRRGLRPIRGAADRRCLRRGRPSRRGRRRHRPAGEGGRDRARRRLPRRARQRRRYIGRFFLRRGRLRKP